MEANQTATKTTTTITTITIAIAIATTDATTASVTTVSFTTATCLVSEIATTLWILFLIFLIDVFILTCLLFMCDGIQQGLKDLYCLPPTTAAAAAVEAATAAATTTAAALRRKEDHTFLESCYDGFDEVLYYRAKCPWPMKDRDYVMTRR
jgi:RsiW-degrading membrane proteinase PrsW (M82 family)